MTTPAFIAILDFSTAAADRPTAIAQLEHERPGIIVMPGCLDFRVFGSLRTDTDITVLHEWADRASFDGYLASAEFARSSELLRPMMTGAPSSRRFRVDLLEAVA